MACSLSLKSYLGKHNDCFAVFGAVVAAYLLIKTCRTILRFLRDHFLGPALGLSANVKHAGSWAVVTGCTDGIGKAYAEQLAKRGLNVVLLSRTKSKLDDLAKDIENKYKVQTRVIAVDFTRDDIYEKIEQDLTGLEIGTLVNNVGMSYEHPMYFLEIEDKKKFLKNIVNCNLLSMSIMTSIVLPGMLERRRGYVINIASAAAEQPVPLLTVYSATKVYMDYFTKGLQVEYGSKGVTFQVVRPNFVATKLSGIRRSNITAPTPDTFVKAALATLGITNSTNGIWIHTLQSGLMQYVPDWVVLSSLGKVRKAGFRRKEKKKAQQ